MMDLMSPHVTELNSINLSLRKLFTFKLDQDDINNSELFFTIQSSVKYILLEYLCEVKYQSEAHKICIHLL